MVPIPYNFIEFLMKRLKKIAFNILDVYSKQLFGAGVNTA